MVALKHDLDTPLGSGTIVAVSALNVVNSSLASAAMLKLRSLCVGMLPLLSRNGLVIVLTPD